MSARYIAGIVFFCLSAQALSNGMAVKILLNSGVELQAEILAVRDDALLVATDIGLKESELRNDSSNIRILARKDIRMVIREGHSYLLAGAGSGLVVGIVGGVLMETEVGWLLPHRKPLEGATYGGLGGSVLGLLCGAIASQRELIFDPHKTVEWLSLRQHARYPHDEPDFLRTIGDQ